MTISRITIVGGLGRMGSLFRAAFEHQDVEVRVVEKGEPLGPRSDVVMFATPLDTLTAVIEEALSHIPVSTVVCDIGSVKGEVCKVLSSAGHPALGLHPMFGPHVAKLEGQRVIVCPVRENETTAALRTLLETCGFVLQEMSAENHDRTMAVIQGALHFSKVILGTLVAKCGVPMKEMMAAASPIYELELIMLSRIFAQNPDTYLQIQTQNPYAEDARRELVKIALALADDLRAGTTTSFSDAFGSCSHYFKEHATYALEQSGKILDLVSETKGR